MLLTEFLWPAAQIAEGQTAGNEQSSNQVDHSWLPLPLVMAADVSLPRVMQPHPPVLWPTVVLLSAMADGGTGRSFCFHFCTGSCWVLCFIHSNCRYSIITTRNFNKVSPESSFSNLFEASAFRPGASTIVQRWTASGECEGLSGGVNKGG